MPCKLIGGIRLDSIADFSNEEILFSGSMWNDGKNRKQMQSIGLNWLMNEFCGV